MYVRAKYRNISERYQEAEKLIFQIYILTVADESILKPSTIRKFLVVFHHNPTK